MQDQRIYYHFLSFEHAKCNLEKERIKVATLDGLNDPFEMVPYLRYKDPKKRGLYHEVHKEISKEYGLLCFSHDWKELLLWSYYAKGHKGIAIGFEILHDEIIDVCYKSDPIRKQFELTMNSETDKKLFLDLAKVKYMKWNHEDECRFLVKITDCISGNTEDTKDYHFLKFNNRLKVKEIVLGCKFDHKNNKEKILEFKEKYKCEVIATRGEWEGYRINKCGTRSNWYK